MIICANFFQLFQGLLRHGRSTLILLQRFLHFLIVDGPLDLFLGPPLDLLSLGHRQHHDDQHQHANERAKDVQKGHHQQFFIHFTALGHGRWKERGGK